jgi:hypothetical protein
MFWEDMESAVANWVTITHLMNGEIWDSFAELVGIVVGDTNVTSESVRDAIDVLKDRFGSGVVPDE